MALNIKNQRVCDLAREAARRTGRSQVSVIEEALERLLREHEETQQRERSAKLARIEAIAQRFREEERDPTPDDGRIRTIEDLYDEVTGLPR